MILQALILRLGQTVMLWKTENYTAYIKLE